MQHANFQATMNVLWLRYVGQERSTSSKIIRLPDGTFRATESGRLAAMTGTGGIAPYRQDGAKFMA